MIMGWRHPWHSRSGPPPLLLLHHGPQPRVLAHQVSEVLWEDRGGTQCDPAVTWGPQGAALCSQYLQQSRGAAVALQQPPVEQHPLAHQAQDLAALVQAVGGFLLL